MDLVSGFVLCFGLLFYAIKTDMFLGVPLSGCIVIFCIIARIRKYSFKEIGEMLISGGRKSLGILKIFIMLGAIGSVWIYSGTIPGIVYYCLKYMEPQLFILVCFIGCSAVSYLNGSSFGTVGTIGVAFITMAKAAGIPADLAAGAIISGAYFGDRGSPVSSAGALVATLTGTGHMNNVRNMHYSGIVPIVLSIAFFGGFSVFYPLKSATSSMSGEILGSFNISWIVLLPAIIMFLLPIFRVNVIVSMGASIAAAAAIGIFEQGVSGQEMLKSIFLGVSIEGGALADALSSGGIKAMLITYVMVCLSCALAGIFSGIHVFDKMKAKIKALSTTGKRRMLATSIVSTFTSAYGCNQTIASILTCEIMDDSYGKDVEQLALDVGNSTLLIAGLIPWSIASFVPTELLGVGKAGYIPFAFFMYAIPICAMIFYEKVGKKRMGRANAGNEEAGGEMKE